MAKKKTLPCRFPGCKHKGFTSRAGRLYHERTKHGRAFSDPEPIAPVLDTPDASITEPNSNEQFVKISEVEFIMAKKKMETKDDDEYEYECPKCNHEFNGKSKYCPNCGCEFA